MRKNMRNMIFILSMMFFMGIHSGMSSVSAKEINHDKKVPINKVWTIKFSKAFEEESINEKNIKVKDKEGNEVQIETRIIDEKTVQVESLKDYKLGASYTLIISEGIKSEKQENLQEEVLFSFETEEYSMSQMNNFIAWEAGVNHDAYTWILNEKSSMINKKAKGQNLKSISPFTFFFNYKDGEIQGLKTLINEGYLERLKSNGYEFIPTFHVSGDNQKVYGTYKNFKDAVKEFFGDEEKEDKLIKDVADALDQLKADKIIIDIEKLGEENKEGFTGFIKKLKRAIGDKQIMICVAYPKESSPYFAFLDIKKLEKYTHGFMFMAYDERTIGSDKPGSISSYEWVRYGVEKLIRLGVPNDKLILAFPFYTLDYAVVQGDSDFSSVIITSRVEGGNEAALYEKADESSTKIKTLTYGEQFVTQDYFEDGKDKWYKVKVGEKSGYIKKEFTTFLTPGYRGEIPVGWWYRWQRKMDTIIDEGEDATIEYDEISRQNVLTYYKYDSAKTVKLKHKVWLEDEQSLQWRLKLVNEFNLKGAAAWRLGYEDEDFYEK